MRTVPASRTRAADLITGSVILAVCYYAGARMGLALAFAKTNVTPVWPPAGIALAALLLWGPRLSGGVWLGAFVANVVTFSQNLVIGNLAATGVSAAIATGNTLGALVGWRLCCRWLGRNEDGSAAADPENAFVRMSVFQFAGAAMLAATVSALVGPLAVCSSHLAAWHTYKLIAFTWWSGDATGILYLTPFILSVAGVIHTWRVNREFLQRASQPPARGVAWNRVWEPALAFTLLAVTCGIVFGTSSLRDFPAPVLKCLPLVMLTWIAVRMGVRYTTFALMILAVIVVWSGRRFFGALDATRELENILVWIAFLWIVGLMFLAMAAAVDAHKRVMVSLRDAKAALEATMDAIPALVCVAHDPQCHRITGNAPAHEMLRVPVGGNLSKTPQLAESPGYEVRINGEQPPPEELAMQKAAATGKPVYGQEQELILPDGAVHFIYGNAVPLLDEHGTSRGCVAAFVDVTDRRRAEEALRASQQHLGTDLAAMTRMQQLSVRLVQAGDFATLLQEILDAAIEIGRADMGNIQLLEDGVLHIVAQRGFEPPFLDFFSAVRQGQAACGMAMLSGQRIIVEDVTESPIFEGKPALEVMLQAGARAVQSTPLVSRSGRILGMFSTHYHAPRRPDDQVLRLLDILARQAADLIERSQGEGALRESEERFRMMADAAPVMIWMSGVDTQCHYFNKPWLEFTGRTMAEEVADGRAAGVHAEDVDRCLETYVSAFSARADFKMEYRLRRHDGEYRWLLDHGVPRFGAAGEFVGYIGSCIDITDLKQVESDMMFLLGLSEQRRTAINENEIMEGAVDTLGVHLGADRCWFATLDAEGEDFTILREHRLAGEPLEGTFSMSGFGPEVVMALRAGYHAAIPDVVHDTRTAGCTESFRRLGASACLIVPILREARVVALLTLSTSGVRGWSQRDASILHTVAERMWLAMERLRLAAELGESEGRFRIMAEWVPVFIFTTEPDGSVDYINARFTAYTGIEAQEAAGFGWMRAIHPDDSATVLEQWRTAIETGQPFSSGLRMVSSDGDYRWFHCHAHPVYDEHFRIVKWFATCADIDELMHSQGELKALNERLEERVEERTAQLVTANHEIEREFRERQRLEQEMLDISEKERRALGEDLHDGLCQHLSGLAFMAETLSFKLRDKGMQEEAGRLDGLTGLIRSAAGQARAVAKGLHPVDVDANGLVAALKDLSTRHSANQVHCRLRCARPVLVRDNSVALHLYRIAQEAVVNALKHASAKEIVIDLSASRDQLTLSVTDDGLGMPEDQGGKEGMGLHLMRYRASVIGGKLTTRRSESGGTVVTCVLPMSIEADEWDALDEEVSLA